MFWVQGSPTDFTSAFIWISCVSLFYNRTNHTFILVTFDMAVPGNIPSLVINTFVALNIVLDKQWRIQLSFMCKHHHTVLSSSTAHFFKKFKLEIHTKRSEDSSGGEKTKKQNHLDTYSEAFVFLQSPSLLLSLLNSQGGSGTWPWGTAQSQSRQGSQHHSDAGSCITIKTNQCIGLF